MQGWIIYIFLLWEVSKIYKGHIFQKSTKKGLFITFYYLFFLMPLHMVKEVGEDRKRGALFYTILGINKTLPEGFCIYVM